MFLILSDFMLYWLPGCNHAEGSGSIHSIHHSSRPGRIFRGGLHPVTVFLGT